MQRHIFRTHFLKKDNPRKAGKPFKSFSLLWKPGQSIGFGLAFHNGFTLFCRSKILKFDFCPAFSDFNYSEQRRSKQSRSLMNTQVCQYCFKTFKNKNTLHSHIKGRRCQKMVEQEMKNLSSLLWKKIKLSVWHLDDYWINGQKLSLPWKHH